jgi:hypothetical protein
MSKEKLIRSDVFQAALLSKIADKLKEMDVKPEGHVFPINVEVTDMKVLDFIIDYPHKLLWSVTLFNDGPDDVYPGINENQTVTPLKPGNSTSVDFHSPKIQMLFLTTKNGGRAVVRGFGAY